MKRTAKQAACLKQGPGEKQPGQQHLLNRWWPAHSQNDTRAVQHSLCLLTFVKHNMRHTNSTSLSELVFETVRLVTGASMREGRDVWYNCGMRYLG